MSEAKNNPSRPGVTPLAGARTVTGPRLATGNTAPGSAPAVTPVPDGSTRLRVVTVAPGNPSFADVEAPSRDRRDPYVGAVIDGRYKVETILGEGGMGVVYRCKHTIIGKQLALKVLRADLARDAEVTERFLNEAKSASAIGNPHIIDISDFGQFPDGAAYFVMEYLTGTPLGNTIEGGKPLPAPRLLAITRQLAEGLSAAHSAGIVHRDLKPDNIFLIERGAQKDFVKILDFGIAKASSNEGKLTRAGAVFGTPHYMSPEQAAGAPVDQRGDIYSIGIIMYELACGRVPFDADNFMGVLTQHMYKAPAPLSQTMPNGTALPNGLEPVIMKCLAKKAEQRYQSMEELIVDIDRLLAGTRPQAANETGSKLHVPAAYFDAEGPPSDARRRPVGLVVGVLVFLSGVVALGLVLRGGDEPVEAEAPPVAAPPPPAEKVVVAPVPAPAPEPRRVIVATEPLDATFLRDGKPLAGPAPVSVDVPEGKSVELVIERDGYKTARLVIDGSEPTQSIKLERLPPAAKPRPASKPASPKPASPDAGRKRPRLEGEIVNPWSR